MRQRHFLVLFFCVCVLIFCRYAILTVYSSTGIPTSERLSKTLIHNIMILKIDRDGCRNLVFDYAVVDDVEDSNYIPTIQETEVLINGSSGRRLSFNDFVQIVPKLIRFDHSKEIYNLFPLHVNMAEILKNIRRMATITKVSLSLYVLFYLLKYSISLIDSFSKWMIYLGMHDKSLEIYEYLRWQSSVSVCAWNKMLLKIGFPPGTTK